MQRRGGQMGKSKLSSGHFRERLRIGGATICLAKVKVGMEVSSAFQRDMATVLVKVTGTAPAGYGMFGVVSRAAPA